MLNTTWKMGLVGLAMLATLGTGVAMAQAPDAVPAAPAQHRSMAQQLGLSADQQARIKGFMGQFREARKADRTEFEGQMKLVLNQNQWNRYQARKADMERRRAQWKSHPEAHRHADGQKMASRHHRHHHHDWLGYLGLSPEQKAQLQAYRETQAPHFKAERQQLKTEIRSVLTPAQQTQFDAMRAQHQRHHNWG